MKIKLLDPRLSMDMLKPATIGSAGYDLCACLDTNLSVYPGDVRIIKTGIALDMSDYPYMAAMLLPRSGLGRQGLILANTIGLIDSDYQGELILNVLNRSDMRIEIKPLDRVAQMVFIQAFHPSFEQVEAFESVTERGNNGHGSTGI